MKELSCLLIVALVLLVLVPAPVFAEVTGTGPAASVSGPSINTLSVVPAATTAPLSLVKKPSPVLMTTVVTQSYGVLIIDSVPTGASIYIDGSLKGTTPLTNRAMKTGSYVVTLKLGGYVDYTTKVTVIPGAVVSVIGTMTPVTPAKVTLTVVPPVSETIAGTVARGTGTPVSPVTTVPVIVTSGTETPVPPVSTVPPVTTVPVTQIPRQVTPEQPGTCTKHFLGSGEMNTASDGRLNCTTLISTDDHITTLYIPEGTLVRDAETKPVPEIRITPVTSPDIPPEEGPDGSRWTGHAYHYLPDHATFDPPVLVSFTLGQDEWDRSDPANLTIMETNVNGTAWERLPTTMDPATRTFSAPARHFSIIGLFSTGPAGNPPVTQQSPMDLIKTATGSNNGPLPLSPVLPDKYAPVAAVVAGVTLSVIGTLASGSAAISRLWDKIIELLKKFFGYDTIRMLNVKEIEKRGIRPSENLSAILFGLSSREILVIGLSALVFAVAFLLRDRLDLKLATVIIFICIGGIATMLRDLAQKYVAYRTGCITEYQFWGLGTVTMIATAWLFGNVFAKPSRTLIRSEKKPTPEESARIKLAGPVMSMAVAIVSLFLIPLGGLFVVAGSAGFTMNLLNCVFSLVPVRPNEGVDIYAWNKLVWAAAFIPLIIFYLYIYVLM